MDKCDPIDAQKLAELPRHGSLSAVYHGEEGLRTRDRLRPMMYLVEIPWLSDGGDASLYYGVANYTALWDQLKDPDREPATSCPS
jgi:hypothetical protein